MPKRLESLYFHFPFCLHLCNYCDFYKKIPQDKAQDFKIYHDYLLASFKNHQSLIENHGYSWGNLKTLYIGGGTPSLWGKEGKIFIETLFKDNNIKLDVNCEFTLEVNPGAWNHDVLKSWKSIGANRFSLGVQSLNPEMIKYLDRVHSIEDVYETLSYFKEQKLNFSVDFMLGLPKSETNNRDVIAELNEVLAYDPSHFSIYILTVKDNYKYYSDLPSEEWIEKEFLEVSDFLTSKGFVHYEVSNFALPGKMSQHNLGYWRSNSVAALGPSATGFLKEEKLRYKWKPGIPEMEIEILTEAEFHLEKMYMALRSEEGIKLSDFSSEISRVVSAWKERNLVHEAEGIVRLNSRGYLLLDSLMSDLFAKRLL